MIAPENAPDLAWKGCRNICVCYVIFGVVGYFGWGDDIERTSGSVITTVYALGFPYSWLARLIALLFCTKTLAVYPLLFWPLCREIENCLEWRSAPVMLRLPWALRRLQHMKIALRVFLVLSSLLPLALYQGALKSVVRFLITFPISLTNSVVPACFCVAAAMIHRNNLAKGIRLSGRSNNPSVEYIGGSLNVHLCITILVTVLVCTAAILTLYGRYHKGSTSKVGSNTTRNTS